MTSLTALEATRYATLAQKAIERCKAQVLARSERDADFEEARKDFDDEIRATFEGPAEDFEAYRTAALEIFEVEWNDNSNWS